MQTNILHIRFWLKDFIPKYVFKRDGRPESKPRPGSADDTMLPGPFPTSDCFATDQRGFSDSPHASARMHSELVLTVEDGTASVGQTHWCSPSHELDCEDGAVEGTATGSTNNMKFALPIPRPTGSSLVYTATLDSATNNPLFLNSPDIDYKGTVQCVVTTRLVTVMFAGLVDAFPAFEAYATLNHGLAKPLFRMAPPLGNTPSNLFGKANRPALGLATWALV